MVLGLACNRAWSKSGAVFVALMQNVPGIGATDASVTVRPCRVISSAALPFGIQVVRVSMEWNGMNWIHICRGNVALSSSLPFFQKTSSGRSGGQSLIPVSSSSQSWWTGGRAAGIAVAVIVAVVAVAGLLFYSHRAAKKNAAAALTDLKPWIYPREFHSTAALCHAPAVTQTHATHRRLTPFLAWRHRVASVLLPSWHDSFPKSFCLLRA